MQDESAECLFCHIAPGRVIAQNDLAYAIRDGFPVTPLHTLVIPRRHIEDYWRVPDAVFSPRNPTLEGYWRGIVLLGRNVASYKFAQTKALAAK